MKCLFVFAVPNVKYSSISYPYNKKIAGKHSVENLSDFTAQQQDHSEVQILKAECETQLIVPGSTGPAQSEYPTSSHKMLTPHTDRQHSEYHRSQLGVP